MGTIVLAFPKCYAVAMENKQSYTILRYRQMVFAIYTSVFLALLGDLALSEGPSFLFAGVVDIGLRVNLFAAILVVLAGVEWWNGRLARHTNPRTTSLTNGLHLGIQLVLGTVGVVLGGVPYALFLLYPPLLFSYANYGRKMALQMSLLVLAIITVRLALGLSSELLLSANINHFVTFTLGLVFVLWLARTIQRETAVQVQAQTLRHDLTQAQRQIREYALQAANFVAADERNRLAQELHNGLDRQLTAVTVHLEKALAFRSLDPHKADLAVSDARETACHALQKVQQSTQMLCPENGELSLQTAVSGFIERLGDLPVAFELSGDENSFSQMARLTLLHVVQEGLTNIYQHAAATKASLNITFAPEQVNLVLHDNGCGIGTGRLREATRVQSQQFGLQGMRERLELVNGELDVDSVTGQGTTLWVCIPQHGERIGRVIE